MDGQCPWALALKGARETERKRRKKIKEKGWTASGAPESLLFTGLIVLARPLQTLSISAVDSKQKICIKVPHSKLESDTHLKQHHWFRVFSLKPDTMLLYFFFIQVERLPKPYGSCLTESTGTLKYLAGSYTKSKCFLECETDYVVSECSCRSFYMPGERTVPGKQI